MKDLRIIKRINEDTGEVQAYTIPLRVIEAMNCNYIPESEAESTADHSSQNNKPNLNIGMSVLLRSGTQTDIKLDKPVKFLIVNPVSKKVFLKTKSVERLAREYSSQQCEEVDKSTDTLNNS